LASYAYYYNPKFYVLTKKQHLIMMLEGFIGNTLAQQLFNFGVTLSSAGLAGMVQPSTPIFTTIIAVALKREGTSWLKLLGIGIAIIGSVLMVLASGLSGNDSTDDSTSQDSSSANQFIGACLILIQCFCSSVYIIIQKPLFAEGMEVRTFTFYLFLYGSIGHVLIGSFFLTEVEWSALPLTLIPIILYTVVFATFIAFTCFVYATSHLPASISALGITLQSFFSPLLAAIFLGELVSYVDILGGIAIVCGIVIVVAAKQREEVKANQLMMLKAAMQMAEADSWKRIESCKVEGQQQRVKPDIEEDDAGITNNIPSDQLFVGYAQTNGKVATDDYR